MTTEKSLGKHWVRLCKLPRFSFILSATGGVARTQDSCGNWVEVSEVQQIIDDAESRIAELEAELVAESRRTAEATLRADQMTEQHRMQGNMLREAQNQRQLLADALGECLVASGLIHCNAGGLSGPQILMFAEDLKGQLSAQKATPDA